MSLLSELEELQRCLEDTTDSESETVLQHKAANDLDTLLHSEYMSLAGISEETHADSTKENEKVVTQDNGAISVSLNSKQDEKETPSSEPTDTKKSGSFPVDRKSIEVVELLDSTLDPNSAEKITQSDSSALDPKSTEITAVSDSDLNPKSTEDAVESAENVVKLDSSVNSTCTSLTSAAESIFPVLDATSTGSDSVTNQKSTESSCSIGNPESAASECSIESKVQGELKKEEDEPVAGEMSKVPDCFVKIEHVFSMTDVNVAKRKSESESPSPKSSSVKKRKLYTEPPFESDIVEVPKGGTSPEALLKLQNSNQLLKIRKPRSSPVRRRIQSEGADSVPGARKKKMSNGITLPVEVVVSPLGVKEPLMEQVAERLGKELLEARVVLKRLNIPVPEDLEGTGISPAKLQNTLEEISKDIQYTLSESLPEKKSRGKPKPLEAGPRKTKQTKPPLQKKPPRKPKRSDVLAKASITARIGPKRKRMFTKKILASKIQSPQPVKNVALKNKVAFKKQNPILKSKNVMKQNAKKNSAPTNEVKSRKMSKTQNAEKVVPLKRVNMSPQRKLIPMKNNPVSLGKKTIVKKVASDSVSKKCLVGKGTSIRKAVVKKAASDSVSKKPLVGKATSIRKAAGGKKSAVERNAAVSPGRKKPGKKPELNIVKLSPHVRPRKNIAEPHERVGQSRAKDEENAGEDEWLVEYLIDEDVDLSTMKDKVSSSDDRRPISSETVPECDSSTDKKVRNCRRPASDLSKMDVTAEWKMAEMKKAIRDLERIADRSMLRLKAEERQVIYLSNKLRYYESDKHFKMLHRILKDAAPGPKQNTDAVFIVDLLLSYCPDDDSEDCNNAVSQASAR